MFKQLHNAPMHRFFETSLTFLENTPASGSSLYKYQSLRNSSRGQFVLSEKPLSLHGNLHLGHIYNKLIKDIIVRYKLLSGFQVNYQAGFTAFSSQIEQEAMREAMALHPDIYKDYHPDEIRRICHEYFLMKLKNFLQEFNELNLMLDLSKSWFTNSPQYQGKIIEVFNNLIAQKLVSLDFESKFFSFSLRKEVSRDKIERKAVSTKGIFTKFEVEDFGNDTLLKARGQKLFFITILREAWEITGVQALSLNGVLVYVLLKHDKISENLLISKRNYEKNQKIYNLQGFSSLMEISGVSLLEKKLKLKNPLQNSKIPLIDSEDFKTYGTDVMAVIPAHRFEDYDMVGPEVRKEGFVDSKGKFNEEMPEWLRDKEVFSKESEKILMNFMENNSMIFQGIELETSFDVFFFKNFNERIIPISNEKWFLKKIAINTEIWPVFHDRKKLKEFKANLKEIFELPISKKAKWGIPIPVFYKKSSENSKYNAKKQVFTNSEILLYISEKFKNYGSDIWYKWDIYELLPKKYRHHADDLIKGEEVFQSEWVDACSCLMNLEECSINSKKNQNAKEVGRKFNRNIDLVVEGEEQMKEWVTYSYVMGCNF